ncbi:MAG TPA: hypothetical protein ENI27_06715 [bacterium]|nr:hypothetical protein [bacterium]
MSDIMNAFPSDYLKEADLMGSPKTFTMVSVSVEKVGDDTKPVVHFQEDARGLVLNKTNANTISDVYGRETDDWTGKKIELYPHTTEFQGHMVPCIRVRKPQQAASTPDDPFPGDL